MTATHYNGSRGPVPIATMPHPHLVNAHAKLVREGDPARAAEIEAMAAQIAQNDAEHAKLAEERGDDPPDTPPPAAPAIGHNNPPEETPFEAIRVHAEDLLVEVRNWADGAAIENQAQADEVARLLDEVLATDKAADAARKREVEPIDRQREEIQSRYNVYIAPLKNKKPGKLPLAAQALKVALSAWLQKLDEQKKAAAAEAQAIADAKAAEARAAMQQAAGDGDFGSMEVAEELIAEASKAQAEAKRAANDKAQAAGDGRARGLRSFFTPMLAEPGAALRHYAKARPDELKAFLLSLAKTDVLNGARSIPGFDIVEERRVA